MTDRDAVTNLVSRIRDRINDAPMPTEHLLDEAADRIAELEAILADIHGSARRMTFTEEWFPGGIRTPPGDYVIMRLGPVQSDEIAF